jgi:hypothetical protein
MGRKYRIISADGHVETPPDPWVAHVPEKWRDRAPRMIRLPDGQGDAWLVEGQATMHTGQNITGPGPVRFAHATYTDAAGNLWVPKTRPGMLSRCFARRDRVRRGATGRDRIGRDAARPC